MSGSVGRLKAVVEIVGREVVRELRKNQFSMILETKKRLETGPEFFSSFWSRDVFVCLFGVEERCNNSSFENFRKDARE